MRKQRDNNFLKLTKVRIKMNSKHLYTYLFVITIIVIPMNSMAEDIKTNKFQMGLKAGVSLGDGEPSNDMQDYGVFGRYRINDQWLLGVGFDYTTYDFENPASLLHLTTDKVYDASISQYIVSAWGEREFDTGIDWIKPFAFAGIGIGIGSDDTINGNLQGGGTFSIYSDAGTEIIPGVGVGVRFPVINDVLLEVAAKYDYHFADWDVRDNVSGKTTSIDDYGTYGGYVAVVYSF